METETKDKINHDYCYYIETINNVPYCNYHEQDITIDSCCRNYVHYKRLKEILYEVIDKITDQLNIEQQSTKQRILIELQNYYDNNTERL